MLLFMKKYFIKVMIIIFVVNTYINVFIVIVQKYSFVFFLILNNTYSKLKKKIY